jgi:prepilin-type processing-associated H-X9-DG protein
MYPEYMTDPKILLCPSSPRGTDPETAFDIADNMAQVWNGSSVAATKGNPNKEFYPCEVDNDTASYFYFGWAINMPGLSDDPHVFTSRDATSLVAEATTYFSGKGIPATTLGPFLQMLMQLPQIMDNVPISNAAGLATQLDTINNDMDTGMGTKLYRLREGIERFFITDINNPGGANTAQSTLSVMADFVNVSTGDYMSFNHMPGGSNVLYMDGHVEFLKYPNGWPVSPLLAIAVGGL